MVYLAFSNCWLLFFTVEDSLKDIQEQTTAALTNVTAQSEKVNDSLGTLQDTLKKLQESDESKEEEFKSIKEDVEVIKGLIPKVQSVNEPWELSRLSERNQYLLTRGFDG
jgi:peroxin-14